MKPIDIPAGAVFGHWVVLGPAQSTSSGRRVPCKCRCGTEKLVHVQQLRKGCRQCAGCRREQTIERNKSLMFWTEDRVRELRRLYPKLSGNELAEHFGVTVRAIRTKCSKLGLQEKVRQWTSAEIEKLRQAYASKSAAIGVEALGRSLGRTKYEVARKAGTLGLTDRNRRHAIDRDALAARMREWYATHEHPKGALGMKHTEETRARIGERARNAWAAPDSPLRSPELTAQRSARMRARVRREREMGVWHPYSRARRGVRADLGPTFFRSAWEANYARFLNLLVARGAIRRWEYEPKTFELLVDGRPHGYTPDFLVIMKNGAHEWHEVKGWMDPKSRKRISSMRRQHPDEVLRVVPHEFFKNCVRQGFDKSIPNWEHGTV